VQWLPKTIDLLKEKDLGSTFENELSHLNGQYGCPTIAPIKDGYYFTANCCKH